MSISNLTLSPEEKLTRSLEAKQVQAKTSQDQPPVPQRGGESSSDNRAGRLVDQPINQPVNQSINQSTNQSINQLTGPSVDRPVAFYIPEIINKKIDEAVQYYQEKYSKKIDRSAVVSALLGDPPTWTHEALDQLVDKVINQLTNRLTSRLTG